MAKKKRFPKVDGLGPVDVKRIRSALRDAWRWNHARQLVIKRCLLPDGFSRCERCESTAPKIFVDHIDAVGEVDAGYIQRLFVPSNLLQGLCKKCHAHKTKIERDEKW